MTKISVFLSVMSDTLSASEISEILGVRPDKEVVKGALRTPPRVSPAKHGWNLSCTFYEYVELDFAFEAVFQRIEGAAGAIRELSDIRKLIDVSVKFAISPSNNNIPMYLSKSNVERIGALSASLDFEYFD